MLFITAATLGCESTTGIGDCASRFELAGRVYGDVCGPKVDAGPQVGEAHFLSCHDDELGKQMEAESWTAYQVEGIPQGDAVAIQESGRRPTLYAREGISDQDLRELLRKVDRPSGTRRTGS